MWLNKYKTLFKAKKLYPLKINSIKETPICCGVYFITEFINNEEDVVYIGSSKNLRLRLFSHQILHKNKKDGISVNIYVIPMKEDVYINAEISFICTILPKYNKNHLYRGVNKFKEIDTTFKNN